uniref:PGG domain-containing protein n=1 Tax=Hordeum vulgare subsp. vulgare TaxID=112509 RepID=A0A8I6YGV6_HORVV
MSEADKANRVAISSGDSSQSQPQEIITVNNRPHMSVDELLKAIKGANGKPVLFVPSSDGRLAAVAVDGLHQNLVPANSFSEKRNQQDFRAWLLLLTSLVATVTFTAGLAPPGGFWDADDRANRHIAGTSIMRDKFPRRYLVFYYSNTTAFFASLMIIGMLAKNVYSKETVVLKNRIFVALVGLCFVSLGTSYITGTWVSPKGGVYNIVMFVLVICYMTMHWVLDFIVWMQRRAT